MTHPHTLSVEAARAGVTAGQYVGLLEQGLAYCWRCQDWHPAAEFDADSRRHTGRAGACRRAIRAAADADLAARGLVLPPPAAWIVRRAEPAAGRRGQPPAYSYWHGPVRGPGGRGRRVPGPWSKELDDQVARFPGKGEASGALVRAYGRRDAVPPRLTLVRLA